MNDESRRWLLDPAPGWSEISGQELITRASYVSRPESALSIRYYQRDESAEVIAKVIFGAGTQGPPGHAHGGSIAGLLDELMGWAVMMGGQLGASVELNVRYRAMLPIPGRYVARAQVVGREGRRIQVHAQLHDEAGETRYSEADSVFVELNAVQLAEVIETPGA